MASLPSMLGKMRELRHNETMTRAQFEAVKLVKFRKLVRHANAKSPYYAQIIAERSLNLETCVPTDFPVLTKSVLMTNFDRIVTDRRITKQGIAEFLTHSTDPNEFLFGEYRVLHTSGSSGEVGYFIYSEADWARSMPQGMRQMNSLSARLKRRGFARLRVAFYGAIGGHFGGVSIATSTTRGLRRLFVRLSLYEVNSPLPDVIAGLNRFKPDVLSGYTTALKILADKQRAGVLHIKPLAVGASGEGMTLADKAMLESAFGCPAMSAYVCSEHLVMGVSRPDGRTMVLYDDDLIFEFFADHSLITNLFNYTLPLIRYRMSDTLRPIEQSNPASPYILIDSLVGRTEKVPEFINRDGMEDFISPHTINEIFIDGVVRFQMRLVSKTSFQFMICLDSTLDASQRAAAIATTEHRLRELLEQKRMSNVTFAVVAVDDLPVDPKTRKFRLIADAQP